MLCHATVRTIMLEKKCGERAVLMETNWSPFQACHEIQNFQSSPKISWLSYFEVGKNGDVSLAACATGFPSGSLPDVIHPHSACGCCHWVAVVSSGKMERGMSVGPDTPWNM